MSRTFLRYAAVANALTAAGYGTCYHLRPWRLYLQADLGGPWKEVSIRRAKALARRCGVTVQPLPPLHPVQGRTTS